MDRDALLAALVCRTFRDHTMVFVRTKREAHRVLILLGLLGVKVRVFTYVVYFETQILYPINLETRVW